MCGRKRIEAGRKWDKVRQRKTVERERERGREGEREREREK